MRLRRGCSGVGGHLGEPGARTRTVEPGGGEAGHRGLDPEIGEQWRVVDVVQHGGLLGAVTGPRAPRQGDDVPRLPGDRPGTPGALHFGVPPSDQAVEQRTGGVGGEVHALPPGDADEAGQKRGARCRVGSAEDIRQVQDHHPCRSRFVPLRREPADRDPARQTRSDGVDRSAVFVETCVSGPVLDGEPDADALGPARLGVRHESVHGTSIGHRRRPCVSGSHRRGARDARPATGQHQLGMSWGRTWSILGTYSPQLGTARRILGRTSGFRAALLTFAGRGRTVVVNRRTTTLRKPKSAPQGVVDGNKGATSLPARRMVK